MLNPQQLPVSTVMFHAMVVPNLHITVSVATLPTTVSSVPTPVLPLALMDNTKTPQLKNALFAQQDALPVLTELPVLPASLLEGCSTTLTYLPVLLVAHRAMVDSTQPTVTCQPVCPVVVTAKLAKARPPTVSVALPDMSLAQTLILVRLPSAQMASTIPEAATVLSVMPTV